MPRSLPGRCHNHHSEIRGGVECVPLFNSPYTNPHAITVDPAGKIYLAEYLEHRVIQLSPGGTLLRRTT